MVETSEGNAKNTKYVYVNSVVKGTFSENSEVHQRTLEHLEWKFLGDFLKSEANGDSKETQTSFVHL